MATSTKKVYQVAVVLYNGADVLDFAGPVEMLTHIYYNRDPQRLDHAFNVRIIAETSTVRAGDALTVTADMTLQEASKQLDDFDVMVVPGGPPNLLMGLVEKDSPEVQLIRNFATHASTDSGKERVALSVCTGALLLAGTGAVGGLRLTTHHMAYDLLRQVCKKAVNGAEAAQVVESNPQRRYVDGGINKAGVRVITAGGITCGLDASLYLAHLKVGDGPAEWAADLAEHEWKRATE
ncbi:MAG: hypothetical protein Q9181_004192 [Wetmoreana brouardii]